MTITILKARVSTPWSLMETTLPNSARGLIDLQWIRTKTNESTCQNLGCYCGRAPMYIAQYEGLAHRNSRHRIIVGRTGGTVKSDLVPVGVHLQQRKLI